MEAPKTISTVSLSMLPDLTRANKNQSMVPNAIMNSCKFPNSE